MKECVNAVNEKGSIHVNKVSLLIVGFMSMNKGGRFEGKTVICIIEMAVFGEYFTGVQGLERMIIGVLLTCGG